MQLARQAGVIPIRQGKICLVTSRSGKRWIIPKGCMEPGKNTGEIALQEAWEEAGLVGLLSQEPIGTYVYEKDSTMCHVILFILEVTAELDNYPENGIRQRSWFQCDQALQLLEDKGLRDILIALGSKNIIRLS